jgi:hypothetical protein
MESEWCPAYNLLEARLSSDLKQLISLIAFSCWKLQLNLQYYDLVFLLLCGKCDFQFKARFILIVVPLFVWLIS